jgi:hypothetical protein
MRGLSATKANFPEKTSVFPAGQKIGTIFCPKGGLAVVIIKITRPKQKKKKNWDNFLGANLQVCHPNGPF